MEKKRKPTKIHKPLVQKIIIICGLALTALMLAQITYIHTSNITRKSENSKELEQLIASFNE